MNGGGVAKYSDFERIEGYRPISETVQDRRYGKGKGFPYSTPSVGPGADPGVQAVSLQVTVSHPPGGFRQACSYFSSRRASPPFGRYQVILLGMYVCRGIYVRAAAYSLNCHGGAMIYRMLYKTFQSLVQRRTESVTSMNHGLSVAVSSI